MIPNYSKVPDEEYNRKPIFKELPTVDSILKLVEKGTYKFGSQQFLSDVFKCGAIAISNKFDLVKAEEREKEYLETINKYDKQTQNLIVEIFANIYMLLNSMTTNKFDDYLGKLYMQSNTSNSKAGQFFTPFCVSQLCSQMTVSEQDIERYMENDEILTMHEPTVGSGGMVLALVDTLYNKYHFNYSRNLVVECGDIDIRCVYMTYLQLGLAGVPAVIYHRDGITLETWDRWITPAYALNFFRFNKVLKVM